MSSPDFVAYIIHDCLHTIPGITVRRMFGGHALYLHGVIIGMIHSEAFYLKADAQDEPLYRERGGAQFGYTRPDGKVVHLPYWTIDESIYGNHHELASWIKRAAAAAARCTVAKVKPKTLR